VVIRKWPLFLRDGRSVFLFPGCCVQNCAHIQATAAWQWHNFWAARAPAGRTVAHINMDETCVRLDPARNVRGAAALTSTETRRAAASLLRHAGLGVRRSAFTLVAFVADNDEAPEDTQKTRVTRVTRRAIRRHAVHVADHVHAQHDLHCKRTPLIHSVHNE
jgi:hypothetical protein